MAQGKKKKSSGGSAKKRASSSGRKKNVPAKAPKRREIGALVCLCLGVFSFLGCFSSDGWFINFFCDLIKGLVGWGFYFLPPVLIICAVILAFHRGRPVSGRVTSALFLTIMAGALYQVLGAADNASSSLLKSLWTSGTELKSGGVLGGGIGVLFTYLFSNIGATIILILISVFLIFVILNQTPSGIAERIKNRERREYEYVPDPEPKEKKNRPDSEAKNKTDYAAAGVRRAPSDIDIPLDSEGNVKSAHSNIKKDNARQSFFNKTPRVTTPDEFISDSASGENQNGAVAAEKEAGQPAETNTGTEPDIITYDSAASKARKSLENPAEPAVVLVKSADSAKKSPAVPDPLHAGAEKKPSSETGYQFPPISLLKTERSAIGPDYREEVQINKERLENTLRSFGINATISNITRGPAVTRYEMELEVGVKLNKLTNLADDIALSLGASGVRIAAIPNKISTVGIEVPNKNISKVYLRDIVDSPAFKNATSKLTFAIGKNISGDAIVGNISKLPHMLVAGTTGSGKSVCLNSLILSIMYKATPDEVKFIMVDPKMVEFKIYNGIPHLLVPVVTEAKKASGALQWAVVEMMKRYRLFSETGARDLASYNKLANDDDELQKLPQIVVVIDELADLMLVAAKEVEESVCRVAQMGRAAGVHLIIATQSPRADVITGLMKANIPSRIALKVSSSLESRIILDSGGNADKLVGNGDMLFAPIGTSKPVRIQGTWVSDEERESIVEFVKKSGTAEYSDEIINQMERAAEDKQSSGTNRQDAQEAQANDYDELLPQAVDVIFESGQASVSMLQRRLKLGYARAARIVDQMEEIGVVGPFEGSKPRQLLITKAQWQEMQLIQNTAPIEKVKPEPDSSGPGQSMFSADDLFKE